MCTVSVRDIQAMLVQVGLFQEPKLNVNGSSGHKKEKTRENISALPHWEKKFTLLNKTLDVSI
jgi:hypothetical protein